ncbi:MULTISPECIES: Na(+)/H(+) antiporter subunit D [Shewanella]|uniref:Na(+)/H(+) antiporter subunit D n=1 Tax=Shewanella psychromarinicola TaxID=2487742 RepID=A0A3N4DCH5_9GAMM|nr:Na(+)/H(+) antiporter subunit D [Shewanella psychromarinicola]AZG35972.1 Na(+)/H(+) antiporter subunit D [Shewanella psychromarinicola]MCL1083184.1 Na(+)/H(+) antiporter subunit D [Shewanella psychromarinicola]RPA23399.1 Na(+)/H(+) antiporter subunit D [Shewanella psychromarinicola]
MTFELFSPAFILLIAAVLICLVKGHARTAVILIAPIITLWAIWQIPDGVQGTVKFLSYNIEPLEGSPLRRLFATIFAIMVFVGGLYSFRIARWYELAAAFAYAAGAIGVCFAGDLITMFLYWELMAIFSTIVVWCGGTPGARAAGIRYAIMHLLGGVVLKVGIEGVVIGTGSIQIQPMLATDFSTWMILIGILINAAAPPVSAWLADAYPESTPTGSVFLSAFTTKTAVLALILLFPGEPVLIGIGLFMVMYGIIFALLENDVRRILAYSVVNQVGFMVVAVGIGTEMALNGATAHAFAHIIYKALLFMSAGVVIYRTGKNKCMELGGLFRTMPLTCVCGIIGALAISSFPLTSGFTTKSMISQAAVDGNLVWVYMALTAASAGVFLHAGIKFPWFVFFQKDSGLRPKDAPWNMGLAMIIFASLCILLGVFPEMLYALLPYPVDYQPYSIGKVLFYLQLLLFSGLAFFVLLPLMKRTMTISLDTDWLWRRAAFSLFRLIERALSSLGEVVTQQRNRLQKFLQRMAVRYLGQPHTADSQERGVFARSWPVGTTVLWIAGLLSAYVLLYYL